MSRRLGAMVGEDEGLSPARDDFQTRGDSLVAPRRSTGASRASALASATSFWMVPRLTTVSCSVQPSEGMMGGVGYII